MLHSLNQLLRRPIVMKTHNAISLKECEVPVSLESRDREGMSQALRRLPLAQLKIPTYHDKKYMISSVACRCSHTPTLT